MKFITHKKANLKYTRKECLETGIKLNGQEVKSIKAGHGSLEGSYVVIRGGEAFLVGMTIPAWQSTNLRYEYDPERNRKLLLKQSELTDLLQYDKKKGFALVPFSLYNKGGLIKVELCVSTNKQTHDRREDIKKRDTERDLERSLKT